MRYDGREYKGLIGEIVRVLSGPLQRDVTGCLLAIGIAPIFVHIEGKEFLAIFSTESQLRQSMKFFNVEEYTIQKITDGRDFLECLWSQGVKVVLDPRPHEGNAHFTLVMPNKH